MDMKETQRFCGRTFSAEELQLIGEVTRDCGGLSRLELAHTVCELLDWRRPGGGLKARECRDFLELLETRGILNLPGKKYIGEITPRRSREPAADGKKPFSPLSGDISMFAPVSLELVENRRQRELFKELRYHYLGYAMPYGARLQYMAYVERPRREVVGCIQYSSPAWRMKARDQWIGWDDATALAACGQQQPVFGRGRHPEPGQHHLGALPETDFPRLAEAIWGRTFPGGDIGGCEAVPWGVLPGCQFPSLGGNGRPRAHGPGVQAPWRVGQDRDGVSPGPERRLPTLARLVDDERIGHAFPSGTGL